MVGDDVMENRREMTNGGGRLVIIWLSDAGTLGFFSS